MKLQKYIIMLMMGCPLAAAAQTDTSKTLVIVEGQDAALAYNKGINYANSADYDQAIALLGEAISHNYKYDKAFYNRGVIELKKSKNPDALKDFDMALSSAGNKPQYLLGKAVALARAKSFDEAIKCVQQAERLGYNKSQVQYFYGYVYCLKGDYGKAQQSYTNAINANSKFAYAYCDRGMAHLRQGSIKAALDDFNTAIDIMPGSGFIYVLRAEVKAAQKNFSQAVNDINMALQIDGEDNVDWLNARGVMYGRATKYKLAMADFNRCLALYPSSPDAHVNMGNMLMDQKKYAEAEQCYTKALEVDPQNISAFNNRANAKELQFNLKGAQADRKIAKQLIDNQK